MPHPDREQVLARCEPVELLFSQVLYRAGERIASVYLPTGCSIALLPPANGSAGFEVGLIGNEGVLGSTLLLGVETAPFEARVQGPGAALRIGAPAFLRELEGCPALQAALKRYLYVSMGQFAQAAVCNRFHVLEARLARWLLMNQDRAHADAFYLTHVTMAAQLGVRRVGITKAANALQQQQLIRYHRGHITVLDRTGLEAASCGCYRADQIRYARLLGSPGAKPSGPWPVPG